MRYRETFDLAELFKEVRLSTGLTQKQVAERFGTTQAGIARLENWLSRPIKLATLVRFAAVLDLDLSITVGRFRLTLTPDDMEGDNSPKGRRRQKYRMSRRRNARGTTRRARAARGN